MEIAYIIRIYHMNFPKKTTTTTILYFKYIHKRICCLFARTCSTICMSVLPCLSVITTRSSSQSSSELTWTKFIICVVFNREWGKYSLAYALWCQNSKQQLLSKFWRIKSGSLQNTFKFVYPPPLPLFQVPLKFSLTLIPPHLAWCVKLPSTYFPLKVTNL